MLAFVLFLLALLRRWMPLGAAAAAAVFVGQVAFYWVPPRPRAGFAYWLRISAAGAALCGGFVFLISHVGGATDFPRF